MKIVFFHAGILPVKRYGGIERLIYWHMVELVKQGHHVTLIGHLNSQVEDKGIKLIPYNPKEDPDFENYIPNHSDIIHLSFNYKMRTNTPILITIHGNGQVGEVFHPNTVFVSKNHAQNHGPKTAPAQNMEMFFCFFYGLHAMVEIFDFPTGLR